MAVGDVDVQVVNPIPADVDTAVTAMRTTANDKWLMCSIHNGTKILIVNIEEA